MQQRLFSAHWPIHSSVWFEVDGQKIASGPFCFFGFVVMFYLAFYL